MARRPLPPEYFYFFEAPLEVQRTRPVIAKRKPAPRPRVQPEVFLMPIKAPRDYKPRTPPAPAAPVMTMTVAKPKVTGTIAVRVSRPGGELSAPIAKVRVKATDTAKSIAERLATIMNRAAAKKGAVRRSAPARNPVLADPPVRANKSELAKLIASDRAAQRIAQGLPVRGWGEATNARNGDAESEHEEEAEPAED